VDDSRPLFQQLADQIADEIIDGTLPEEGQVPSTTEFAAFHRINPATALKGVTLLVDDGILYKKRGIGMFVATGARDRLLHQRREKFRTDYVRPLLAEAAKLGIGPDAVADLIRKETS
jgi:DNA-binding transcriptional regulator YhcF (GntR family)